MSLTDPWRRAPFWLRLFYRIPVIGWVARDLVYGDEDNLWYTLAGFVCLWMCQVLIFGLPVLYLPALALVPVIFLLLVLISRG